MRDFLAGFTLKRISIFIFVVTSFTYNVLLDREMRCTCKNTRRDCYCFLLLPAVACMIVILMTDKAFHRTWCNMREFSRTCCRAHCLFCGKFWISLGKALLVGLLWTVSVFMDGDWHVCCGADFGQHPQLACKYKKNITHEEKLIITDEKNLSWVWGISMLIGILFLGVGLSLFEKCCAKNPLFNELVVQEQETVLDEVVREKIKEKLNNKIKTKMESGEWSECLTVAEDLIDEGPSCLRRDDGPFYS